MSFGDGIFDHIHTFNSATFNNDPGTCKAVKCSYAEEDFHISEASLAQVILCSEKCLVLVLFVPVSALFFRRKCHQRVSLLSNK